MTYVHQLYSYLQNLLFVLLYAWCQHSAWVEILQGPVQAVALHKPTTREWVSATCDHESQTPGCPSALSGDTDLLEYHTRITAWQDNKLLKLYHARDLAVVGLG